MDNAALMGPMAILKELWTGEFDESEVKTSYQYVIDLREKLEQTLKLAHEKMGLGGAVVRALAFHL